MNSLTEGLVAAAALAVVVFVGIYSYEHTTCWHIPYFTDGCVVHK